MIIGIAHQGINLGRQARIKSKPNGSNKNPVRLAMYRALFTLLPLALAIL